MVKKYNEKAQMKTEVELGLDIAFLPLEKCDCPNEVALFVFTIGDGCCGYCL